MTIYEKYGGFDFFHKCVYGLYLDMFDHPEIAYHFIGVDLVHLSKLQTQFLVRAIGGPDTYQGGDIKLVHRSMQISTFEFTEIANAFRGVFLKAGVEKADVDVIMNFIASHEGDIVTAKTNFMVRIMRPIYKFCWRYLRFLFSKDSSWLRVGRNLVKGKKSRGG